MHCVLLVWLGLSDLNCTKRTDGADLYVHTSHLPCIQVLNLNIGPQNALCSIGLVGAVRFKLHEADRWCRSIRPHLSFAVYSSLKFEHRPTKCIVFYWFGWGCQI